MAVKQVYFSEITERHLLEKANGQDNFSRYVKDLMMKENFIDEIRQYFVQGEQGNYKPKDSIINQFI